MAEWKKIIVSGSGLSQLDNDSGYLTSFGSVTQHNDVTNAGSGKIITDTERTTLGTALQSLGSVTGHTDVSSAGSGIIITDAERLALGTALQSLGSVTGHTDVSNAGSGKIITDTERTTLGTALQSLGSVTGHTDVSNAGSGRIITDAERAAIGALNNFTGSLNANFATDAELAAVSGALASDISAIDSNVTTNLAEGTATNTTVKVTSSDGTDATLASASTSRAGLMSKAKFDEVEVNNKKVTNAATALSTGTVTGTTYGITSDGGSDDVILAAASTTDAGVMSASDKVKLNNIDTNANDYTLTIADVKAVLGGGMPSNTLSIGDANDTITIGNDLVVTGDLTVSGTTTTLDVTNLDIEDQFINIAKGIGSKEEGGIDGGIVIEGQQTAFGWDESADRWAFDYTGATKDQTAIASDAFAVTVHKPTGEEGGKAAPDANYEKDGNIYIAPKTGDIFIYVE